MAILKPVSAYPNKNTIDVTKSNVFSTIIQGSSTIVSGYQVFIYDMDTYDNIYSTEKIQLQKSLTAGQALKVEIPINSEMINGYSYFWTVRIFQDKSNIFITNSVIQSGSTGTNLIIKTNNNVKPNMFLKIGDEKRKILTYEKTTGATTISSSFSIAPSPGAKCEIYSDFVDSVNFPFYAKITPVIEIRASSYLGSSRACSFNAIYTKGNAENVKWHRFVLFDSNDIEIKDTGKIYSSDLSFSYEKFQNGEDYKLKCYVEDGYGILVESETLSFPVSYENINFNIRSYAEPILNDGKIRISWEEDRFSEGIQTGECSFILNSDLYKSGQTLTGTPESNVNYSWLEKNTLNEDTLWNESYYWTETIETEINNRVEILSGQIYYDKLANVPVNINENTFTLLTDIRLNNTTIGRLITLSSDLSEYFIEVENDKIYSTKDNVKTFLQDIFEVTASGQSVSSSPSEDVGYHWEDIDTWDEGKYWVETMDFKYTYKVVILPEEVKITKY